eukprot:217964-Chlamydomonas_euryale.AAC.6
MDTTQRTPPAPPTHSSTHQTSRLVDHAHAGWHHVVASRSRERMSGGQSHECIKHTEANLGCGRRVARLSDTFRLGSA